MLFYFSYNSFNPQNNIMGWVLLYTCFFNRYGIVRLGLFNKFAWDHTVGEPYVKITTWLHRRIQGTSSSRNIHIVMFF